MARNYAALLHEYLEEMDILSDAEFGRLCRALLAYSMDGREGQLEGAEKVLWKRVKNQEDRFQESYKEQANSKRTAGKKGAAKRWQAIADDGSAIADDGSAIADDGSAINGITGDSKNGYTETETETKTKTKTKTEASGVDKPPKREKADAFSEFAGGDPSLMAALRDFEKMRKTIKKPMTDRAKHMLVNKLRKEFSPEIWIAVLEQSINRCWADIYALKDQSSQYFSRQSSPKGSAGDAMGDLQEIYRMFDEEGGS